MTRPGSNDPTNPVLLAALGVAGLLLTGKPSTVTTPTADGKRSHDDARASAEPTQPPPGWWAVIKRVAAEIGSNQLMTQAAAITFYALLSIFPALAALVSIYGLVADPATIVQQVDSLSAVLPGGGQKLLSDQLNALTSSSGRGLGWGVALGVATSLWTANNAMKAFFNALNAVHEIPERRGTIKLTALTLAFTLGVVLFLVVAMVGVVVVPAVLQVIPLHETLATLLDWLRWPALLLIVALLLAVLFRYGPSRADAVWRWISYGSGFAAIGWVLVSLAFSFYVANFGSYDKTYGSLGAVIGFMTWIWISSTVVLIGAQLDAELEKSSPRG